MTAAVRIPRAFIEIRNDELKYAESLLWIRDKLGNRIHFRPNVVQRRLAAIKKRTYQQGKKGRFIILKARREGVTTYEQADSFHKACTRFNQMIATIAHTGEDAGKIFRMVNFFYNNIPPQLRPQRKSAGNSSNLELPNLNSMFEIGTAGSKAFARGSTYNKIHCTEVTRWPRDEQIQRDLMSGITEAASHGEVVLESTAFGVGGMFHNIWTEAREGNNEWTPIFFTWWDDPTNRVSLNDDQADALQTTLTDEEIDLAKRHDLSLEQIAWRREKQKELKTLFKQEYPEDDVTCFLVSGHHFFDLGKISELVPLCKPVLEVRRDGAIKIWVKAKKGQSYVIGADVAEGTAHGDFFSAHVLDAETCEQVACIHERIRPEVGGKWLAELGHEYNDALIAVEANNHGHSTLNTLVNVEHYTRVYRHKDYDAYGGKPKLGWQTNEKTRAQMLDTLRDGLENRLIRINDRGFIQECYTFEDNGTGKYEAKPGFHDDKIFSLGIAYYVRRWAKKPKIEWM